MKNMVTCQLCNKQYVNKIQTTHLRKFHDMTRGEYELQFGKGSSYAIYDPPDIPLEEQIECKICGEIHRNSISYAHLKLHGWTTKQYKEVYGEKSLMTDFQRNKLSMKYKGTKNPNYGNHWDDDSKSTMSAMKKEGYANGTYTPTRLGVTVSDETKQKQSETMKLKYSEGEIIPHLKGKTHSIDVKEKISNSVKEYAKNNKDVLSQRGKRAHQTCVKNGTNTKHRTGRRHSEETRKQLSKKLLSHNQKKSEISHSKLLEFITNEGYIVEHLDSDSKGYITFICNCGSGIKHTTTRQLFHPSKYVKNDNWCRFCDNTGRSKGELEIATWLTEQNVKVLSNYRSVIYPYELDIYLPDHNVAIEFNGLYWHSELQGKDKHYHNIKRELCESNGIRLIQVFEDEWYNKSDIVKSIIRNSIHQVDRRIFARKCKVESLDVTTARNFIDQYHIGGYHSCSIKLGLYHDDELISVMTFSKGNHSRKGKGWEIDRYCSKAGIQVVGGASKLFKHFILDVDPSTVISYADLRYGTGNVYAKMGFTHDSDTVPNYWYFKDHLVRYHRFTLRKGVVDGDDSNSSEWENRVKQGWNRIWDCGSRKFIWKK